MMEAERFPSVNSWERPEYERLAKRLGSPDEETVWDFLGTLPYDTTPEATDAHEVLDWLAEHGWRRDT